MIKIIVDSEELKQIIIEESEYIHDYLLLSRNFKKQPLTLDVRKTSTLTQIYKNPELIEVKESFKDIDKFHVE